MSLTYTILAVGLFSLVLAAIDAGDSIDNEYVLRTDEDLHIGPEIKGLIDVDQP